MMVPDTITCELMSWEDFAVLARTLALRIQQSRFQPDLVIAVGRGGYVPARVVCDFLLHDMLTSIKVEHWGKAAEEKASVNIRFPLAVDIRDKAVLVIDDVTDTGKTMDMAVSYLRSLNPREIRTAVLQHKVSSSYRPDYFGREEREWHWIIYPWAVHEDVVGFVEKILSSTPVDEKGIMTAFAKRYQLTVPLSDIRDALEDLLDRGRITQSGNLYKPARTPAS
jgi:hypoxanthine phosphoribosyltransferase